MNGDADESAFDNFLQGKDTLSALLRATPGFEPPAAMTDAFALWVKEAQTTRVQTQTVAVEPPLNFEPPLQIEQTFLREAATIQAAQAPRRAAVLQQLADGQSAAAVLGADVTAATRAWLDRQQAERASSAAMAEARPVRESVSWRQSLPRFGLVFSIALVVGIAMNARQRQNGSQNPQTVALAPTQAPAEKAATPAATASMTTASTPVAPAAPTLALATPGILAQLPQQKDPPRRRDMPPPQLGQPSQLAMADNARPAARSDSAAATQKSVAETSPTRSAAPAAGAVATSATAAAPASASPPPAAPAPAPTVALAPPRAAPTSASTSTPASASAPAVAVSSPPSAALGAMAKTGDAVTSMASFNASLSDDVGQVVNTLIGNNLVANAQGQQLWIMTAAPESAPAKEWAERLRLALPPAIRPIEIQLQTDAQLAPGALRIELR